MLAIKDYILITPANIEPITLDEVKQRLRLVGNSDFDSELTRLITVAREMCERITGRDLINKTYKGFLDYYCNQVEFTKSKLQSISSIKYYLDNVNLIISKSGIIIKQLDTSEMSLTYVNLDATKFSKYECKKNHIIYDLKYIYSVNQTSFRL